MLNVPDAIVAACSPLWDLIPLDEAMPRLTGAAPRHGELVTVILASEALRGRLALSAGLWLYVDDLVRCHALVQSLDDATGAYWHAIMHRREGDFANSRYWIRRAAGHPLLRERPEMDPAGFVDAVEADRSRNQPALVERQRREWKALFEWSANNTG